MPVRGGVVEGDACPPARPPRALRYHSSGRRSTRWRALSPLLRRATKRTSAGVVNSRPEGENADPDEFVASITEALEPLPALRAGDTVRASVTHFSTGFVAGGRHRARMPRSTGVGDGSVDVTADVPDAPRRTPDAGTAAIDIDCWVEEVVPGATRAVPPMVQGRSLRSTLSCRCRIDTEGRPRRSDDSSRLWSVLHAPTGQPAYRSQRRNAKNSRRVRGPQRFSSGTGMASGARR